MEEAPGDGSDFVKELESASGSGLIDGIRADEDSQVGVDLFGRGVGDPPMVDPITARTTVTFGEIRGHRRMGVALARATSVEDARAHARRIAEAVTVRT